MDPIKIIFFDIDGTLIDMKTKKITARTVETLQRLRANGIKLCIASGRAPYTLPDFGGAEFDAFLTFNGSLCYAGDTTIFSNPIPAADVQQIIRNATGLRRPVAIATRERIVANGADKDLLDYFLVAKDVPHVTDEFDAISHQEIFQFMMGCRASDYPAILHHAEGAKIAAWWDRAADIIPASGGKGIGIQKVLAFFHLDPAQAMAFGDGNNDIEMLQAVGTGVAMQNASPELKAVAKDQCGAVSQDGIYHYCLDHHLI